MGALIKAECILVINGTAKLRREGESLVCVAEECSRRGARVGLHPVGNGQEGAVFSCQPQEWEERWGKGKVTE